MKSRINKEFAARHGFALAVFLGLGAWFGYDAFVSYPSTPADALYASIEKAEPPAGMSKAALEDFKRQKTSTQKILCAAILAIGFFTALNLLAALAFSLDFGEEGFTVKGAKFSWSDIKEVDFSKWGTKRILAVAAGGKRFKLDAWHNTGVEEFYGKLREKRKEFFAAERTGERQEGETR